MSIRHSVYGVPERDIRKKAAFNMPVLMPIIGDTAKTVGDLGATGAAYLLASAMMAGAGAGWLGAKLTAHGDRDIDTMKKSYENQRLRADIGYLKGRVQQEADAAKRKAQPQSARVII